MGMLSEVMKEKLEEHGFRQSGCLAPEEAERQAALMGQKKNSKHQDHYTCLDLEQCKTVREFKDKAKAIFLESPEAAVDILGVIKAAQNALIPESDREKLIRFCDQVRDGLKICPRGKVEQFLNRSFRRANSTFEIPEGWLR